MDKLLDIDLQFFAEDGEGGEVQEVAEPATVDGAEAPVNNPVNEMKGEEAQEVAEPAEQKEDSKDGKTEQDSRWAEKRREYEKAKKELDSRDAWIKENFGEMGIETWDDYQSAIKKQQQEEREKEWQSKGYDPEEIRKILQSDPQYKELISQNEKFKQELAAKEAQNRIQKEIEDLDKNYNLGVKNFEDLKNLENFDKMLEYAKNNPSLTLSDAYLLSDRGKILEQAKQQARNGIDSKSHITNAPTGGDVGKEISVPDGEMHIFKKFFPKKTEKEIKEWYKKYGN